MRSGDDALVPAYEALRTFVLTGTAADSPAGKVVLLRQGVAAWMAHRSACAFLEAPTKACAPTSRIGHEIQTGLVQALANLALARQGEVHI